MLEPVIVPSARKGGVADDDMQHAVRNAIAIFDQEDGMVMHIGPARSGALLEVGLVAARDTEGLVIAHAMPARDKYLRRL